MEPFVVDRFGPGRCPECGVDLAPLDIRAHALNHFPDTIERKPPYLEALARRDHLMALADARELADRRAAAEALLREGE